VLCLENHFRDRTWAADAVDITFRPEVFRSLVHLLDGTSVRVNYDTAQPVFARTDPVALLAEVADRVVSVHAGERRWGEREHTVIGTGDVDWDGVFRVLTDARFDGCVSVEDGSNAGDDGTLAAVTFLRPRINQLTSTA
jgi:sugar phosphate isomerase/epimerase